MNVIEEVLRMRYACGRSQREIGSAYAQSVGTVNGMLQRGAGGSGVAVAGGPGRGRVARAAVRQAVRAELDFGAMDGELSQRKSLTLQQLWREYREARPDEYG